MSLDDAVLRAVCVSDGATKGGAGPDVRRVTNPCSLVAGERPGLNRFGTPFLNLEDPLADRTHQVVVYDVIQAPDHLAQFHLSPRSRLTGLIPALTNG